MKYLIAIAFTFFSISIFAQGKFDVQGDLAPTGAYGIVKARNLKGGYLGSVHDTVARNLIPITYRDSNTLVFTRVDSTMWILKGGLTNDYWSVLSTGGSGLDTTKVPYTGANQPLISTFYIQGSSLRSDTMRAASSSGFRMYSSGGSEIGVFGAGSTNFGNYVGKQSYRTNINGSLSGNDFTTQGSVDSALAYKATVDALEDTAANLRSKISADSAFIAAINARQDDTLAAHNTRIIDNVNAINTNAANINLKVNKSGDVITGRFTTQSLVLNKDSIPITSTNRWLLAIDTTTGRVQRIWYFTALPDTTISSNYTLTSRDIGRSIYCTNTSLITITIPTGLTTGLINLQDRRCNIGVYQEGTGNGLVQFAGSGVTLQSTEGATKTRVENSYAEIKFKSDTVVKLVGDII